MLGCMYKFERLLIPDGGVFGIIRYDPNSFIIEKFKAEKVQLPQQILNAAPRRQAEFFAGRLAVKYALTDLIGTAPPVGVGVNREPIWPNGVIGSISHSNGIAIVQIKKISNGTLVGIDIEHMIDFERTHQLKYDILTKNECMVFESKNIDISYYFTWAFSAKEALFKALYSRVLRYMEFSESRIVGFDLEQYRLELVVDEPDIQGVFWINLLDFDIFVVSIVSSGKLK